MCRSASATTSRRIWSPTGADSLRPTEIPYAAAQEIYAEAAAHFDTRSSRLPLSEAAFRRALTAENMVRASLGLGGPQPAEVARMLEAQTKQLAADTAALAARRTRLADASKNLDATFARVRAGQSGEESW